MPSQSDPVSKRPDLNAKDMLPGYTKRARLSYIEKRPRLTY